MAIGTLTSCRLGYQMRSLAISRASHPHIYLKDLTDYLGVILQPELSPLKQRLLTTAERAKHGLAEDPSCPICGHSLEDILHVIRDCTLSKEVWKQVNPSSYGAEANWACLFGLLAWRLWKNREWTYLNTDGAVQVDSGDTVAGGVQRGKNGEWILGYNKYLGNCSILDAELWGILDGLKLI
ncbi:uncharacterized protein LOC128036033 [Gossypium raimondii]|uniref:uncharacterized protein LOC128036033 n=1 Tax=Gossypium raimondii TaxID=29730 RepID=UPI00227C904E|nr:uncharacterized protein LOC128036033 [Gossypium raimondii]